MKIRIAKRGSGAQIQRNLCSTTEQTKSEGEKNTNTNCEFSTNTNCEFSTNTEYKYSANPRLKCGGWDS